MIGWPFSFPGILYVFVLFVLVGDGSYCVMIFFAMISHQVDISLAVN